MPSFCEQLEKIGDYHYTIYTTFTNKRKSNSKYIKGIDLFLEENTILLQIYCILGENEVPLQSHNIALSETNTLFGQFTHIILRIQII